MSNSEYTYKIHPEDAFVFEIYDKDGNPVDAPPASEQIQRFFDGSEQKRHDRARIFRRSTRLLAEGDSWVNWSLIGPFFPDTFVDVLDRDYSILNLGFPGDRFDRMLRKKDYIAALKAGTIDYFIFSGGGNDFLGGGVFEDALNDRNDLGSDPSASDCLKDSVVNPRLDKLERGYMTIAGETADVDPDIPLLVHGYDYAIPRPGGSALGERLEKKNYDPLSALSREIVRELVDRFYARLGNVARSMANTTVVNLRGAVGGNWFDELHPNDTGAALLADRFRSELPQPAVS